MQSCSTFLVLLVTLKIVDSNSDSSVRFALRHNMFAPRKPVGHLTAQSLSLCALASEESFQYANVFQFLDLGDGEKVCRIFSEWAIYFSIGWPQFKQGVSYHAAVIANTTCELRVIDDQLVHF